MPKSTDAETESHSHQFVRCPATGCQWAGAVQTRRTDDGDEFFCPRCTKPRAV